MASSTIPTVQSGSLKIPKLYAQVNKSRIGTTISVLQHGHPSADPTADGLYDWNNPSLTLFTRDMTQDILDLQPRIVLMRSLSKARNASKGYSEKGKRWTIPGASEFDGLQYHGGNSSINSYGSGPGEFGNLQGIPNNSIKGYNHVAFDNYQLPVNRCVVDRVGGTYLSMPKRAIPEIEYTDSVRYSQHKQRDNFYMIFKVVLAIPNPSWTATNHENRWLLGEGQTIIVEPQKQTFNDGTDNTTYYIGWRAKVRD